jgi:hypothetical protein
LVRQSPERAYEVKFFESFARGRIADRDVTFGRRRDASISMGFNVEEPSWRWAKAIDFRSGNLDSLGIP